MTTILSVLLITAPAPDSAATTPCATPVSHAEVPHVADCLFILKAAVGATACEPACICRLSGNGIVSAADALLCLRAAVAEDDPPPCDCGGTTTTTTLPAPIGTCEFSGTKCGSRFGCEESCFETCATPRNACYDDAEVRHQACVARCPADSLSCPRLCELSLHGAQLWCDRAYEECSSPCDDERCEGLHDGPRFEDTGLTVIDYQTGLEWEKKTTANVTELFTWSLDSSSTKRDGTAFTVFLKSMNDPDREGGCYAGHCDWRLPRSSGEGTTGKRPELESIRNFVYCLPAIDCVGDRFGPVPDRYYWSSTTDVHSKRNAWGVILSGSNPYASSVLKFVHRPVRAVRDLR